MQVRYELKEIFDREFAIHYLPMIQSLYRQHSQTNPTAQRAERKFAEAFAVLEPEMSESDRKQFAVMDVCYSAQQKYAARYCFAHGLYAGFQQYFDPNADPKYYIQVENEFFKPHQSIDVPEFWELFQQSSRCSSILYHSIQNPDHRQYLLAIDSAYCERIQTTVMIAYYCGYQAALTLIDEISPHTTGGLSAMMPKILYTEFLMGLTKPYLAPEYRYPHYDE